MLYRIFGEFCRIGINWSRCSRRLGRDITVQASLAPEHSISPFLIFGFLLRLLKTIALCALPAVILPEDHLYFP
ncbi:MAG: hypothetical protein B7X09_02165 [Acidiphilium sp. 21-66-27]|nr:MAG: hypothetical protein B7Z76_14355 [Acidiphilium sp. 20-67-58]OYV67152.1 MAG: hypothetical protein B7X09_02165 [Acidiphilium sp. 21-66-27]